MRDRAGWNLFDPDVLVWHARVGFAPDFLRHLGEMRMALEPEAAALAAPRRTRGRCRGDRGVGGADERATDRAARSSCKADLGLHLAIADAADNPFFLSISTLIEVALVAMLTVSSPVESADAAGGVDRRAPALVAAIAAGDRRSAARDAGGATGIDFAAMAGAFGCESSGSRIADRPAWRLMLFARQRLRPGSSRAAERAGMKPKTMPIRRRGDEGGDDRERSNRRAGRPRGTASGRSRARSESAMPATPPTMQTSTASVRNCRRMSPRRAPTAMRMPISRVRSVTDTSMMFITPMPPTISEITAMAEISSVSVWLVDWMVSRMVLVFWRKKSVLPWRRVEQIASICAWAVSMSALSATRTVIWLR